MTVYEDLVRKAEILEGAAHRAADRQVSIMYYQKARKIREKARNLSIMEGSERKEGKK